MARRCNANSKRTGEPCGSLPGHVCEKCGVCRWHGCNCKRPGGAPKGNKNATTHGIYAVGMRDDEKEIWHEIPLGTLDDEIKLARLQLRRAFEAQARAAGLKSASVALAMVEDVAGDTEPELDGLELTAASFKQTPQGREITATRTRPDFRAEIYRLLGRIGDLEVRRATLTGGQVKDPRETAEEIRRALAAIEELESADDEMDAA